jgi:Ni/Co efflux regulator RcnB
MKRLLIATSLVALTLSGSAFADKDKGKKDKPHPAQSHGYDDGRHDSGLHRGHHKQAWKRGERIPVVYLEPRYYVRDYREYRLAPPPKGYVWVRPYEDVDQYYMVQLTTGLISQIFGD